MIEVVFSNSACGTLKLAQRYGTREYSSGIVGLLLDGEQPSEQEIETARCKAEGQARREWETTVPLGGDPADVYCLDLALSIGEITEDEVGIQRQRVFGQILFICPMDIKGLQENLRRTKEALAAVCARSAAGEAIRIWYSHNPDELCGLSAASTSGFDFWICHGMETVAGGKRTPACCSKRSTGQCPRRYLR